MKFGYCIFYVTDVAATLDFFQHAFGLQTAFLHESNQYGELATGDTKLAFAALELATYNFAGGVQAMDCQRTPQAAEIALVCTDVAAAYQQAIATGARALAAPLDKPWGQTVAYVQTPQGVLVELCSPI